MKRTISEDSSSQSVFGQSKSLKCTYPIPQDDQSILIETSSCNLQFFSELITTQLREFHTVSPQVVFLTYLPHHAKLQVFNGMLVLITLK